MVNRNIKKKQAETFECPRFEQCPESGTSTNNYIGNFVYDNGHLQMVYHPEGIIRSTPSSAKNETDYVYDYFIKDYLGNVRVVLTEENATYDSTMVASMDTRVLGMPFGIPGEGYARSAYRAAWEEDVFDNIEDGRELKPDNYPLDESFPLNLYIAEACPEAARRVVAKNDMTIGPSKVLSVQHGQLVQGAVRYFYEEDAPGQTYDNLGFLVNEILVSMAAAGAGVLPWGENQLIDLVDGNTDIGAGIFEFLSTEMDTTRMQSPHGYLIWLAYDENLNLDPSSSGAARVVDPNELGTLLTGQVKINKDGYLHVYVSNGTASKVINFDNFYITTMQGQTRQINHYYPFGMRMRPLSGKKYNNLYTGKELQTGEHWDPSVSTGLEMYDFEARFFDPQLGRWMVPDPAEQFANPYLAMGNNPINGTDPNGEFFIIDSWIVGFVHGFFKSGNNRFENAWNQANHSAENDAKIWGGLLTTDENKHGFFQKAWEIVSRFTYQLPQTVGGFATAQTSNSLQNVNWVKYKYGATVVQRNKNGGSAVTLGNYIVGDNEIEADANNSLFQHEYGHYIQSQAMGWAYIPRVGIPSLKSALSGEDHNFFITEQDANRRAFLYFNKELKEDFYVMEEHSQQGKGWDFVSNPINIDGSRSYGQYVDYNDLALRKRMNDKLSLHPKWYDYVGWFTIPGVGGFGVINYNSMK